MTEGLRADPEVEHMVESIRDRFGLRGLRDAARLIDGEIARVAALTDEAFVEEA